MIGRETTGGMFFKGGGKGVNTLGWERNYRLDITSEWKIESGKWKIG